MTQLGKKRFKESVLGYLFLLPALVILAIFTFWPVGFSFVLSFFKWDFRNMNNPYFYGFGNYKEILKFDYPVEFPFYKGLFYSILYMTIALFILFSVSQMVSVIRKKKTNFVDMIPLIVVVAYFVLRNYISFTLSIISSIILLLFTFIALKRNILDTKMIKEHGWISFLIWLVSYVLIEFQFPSLINGKSYGIIDYFLDASEKNLFFKALTNTTYYVILTVPIGIALSLLIALLLNNDVRLKAFFRTSFFIPFVTSTVAVGLIWKWIFNDDVGLLNYLLTTIGLQPVKWLKDAKWTIPTVSIVSIWKSVGYNAMIFLAGLQSIDTFYYEAAEVDGASSFQKFTKITWPLLSPTTFFLLIVSVIGSFKVFQEVFILYDGLPGPYGNSGMTMVYYVFDLFYRQQRMGIASAAAYLLFLVILVFTFVQYRVGDKVVEYVS
ncbi:MAG TPA: sugar ABC transporter permease [Fervidobacterium sp.]|nr:sugar ABC transporter permease [Fervidobacterium sp.]HPC80102.1 sugar ABC transporter permease [Fervidobacterium sp.]HRB91187.1 sugar ABC transporter permease [Fervidobacterium sp.]HRV38514.1 sugar ABC transporter permease [Fervidobacterium sp.]